MKRRKFTSNVAMSMVALPWAANLLTKREFRNFPFEMHPVPLGLDAHSVRGMQWKAKQLINYANELELDSLLLNGLEYFESLEENYLMSLKEMMNRNEMTMYFGIGGLSINSPSYKPLNGTPKELITLGLRLAGIFGCSSVNCKIGSIKDRYTDGGIIARMEEIINELSSMRSQIQDAGVRFAVENHAGDLRSEELLDLVETVGTDICGVMLDPGNAVWAMEDPMNQLRKLGNLVLCTSVRDYRLWQSPEGATLQWTAIGEGAIDFVKYTEMMSELCPRVPLQIESISNVQLKIPYLKEEFWAGYPNLKAAELLDFYSLVRNQESIDISADSGNKEESQKRELLQSITFLRNNCELIQPGRN